MSASQRTKGAGYEREVCAEIRAHTGIAVSRDLSQSRDGGGDILLGRYRIECKRRAKIALYDWVRQARESCEAGELPVVACRADREYSLIVMRLEDWLDLIEKPCLPGSPAGP